MLTASWSARAQVTFNPIPSRIVGQPILQQQGAITATAPNLAEGREFLLPRSVVVDTSSTPAILYIADTGNNRVLAWRNASAFTKGDFADKVIGQRDFYNVLPRGPSTDLSTGLANPVALAVDKSGNLYVTDAGNNRIVRYPAPFSQTGDLLTIDLIIGQKDFTGRAANEGLAMATEKTVSFQNVLRAGLAFDPQGNLWASDPGNNRVLRYRASLLTPGNFEPSADIVLGQIDFNTGTVPANTTPLSKTSLGAPTGIAFDPQGRLFVADAGLRVVVFTPPLAIGKSATRIMGLVIATADQPNPLPVSDSTLGNLQVQTPPESVFFVGNNPFVVDRGNARILKYDPFDQWPAETTAAFSPKAIAVFGQNDFASNKSNQDLPQPSEFTLSGPVGAHSAIEASGVFAAAFAGNDLYVVDSGNNRVLVFPQLSGVNFKFATRLLGQIDFKYNAANLIEGREFFFQKFDGSVANGSVAIDSNSNHMYVSDPGNNRVLGFADYRKVAPGSKADLVIGQLDFNTALINYPTNDINQITESTLYTPQGVAVDADGNLWVADSGNGRVLRFAKPFDQPAGTGGRANLVLGQSNFFTKFQDASSQTMRSPFGIAFTFSGHVLVSDRLFNRILFFKKPATGDFTNGQSAASVIGQKDFSTLTENTLSSPRAIAVDPDDRLYVADSGNNRIAVYRNVPSAGNDPLVSFSLVAGLNAPLNAPVGVAVNIQTGEVWVSDTGTNHVFRYPKFDTLVLTPTPNVTIASGGPLGIALDPFGSPVVAESFNRVAFYYPAIDFTNSAGGIPGRFSGNGANYFQRFAPSMIASIFAFPSTHFGVDTAGATSTPLPTSLGDVQVFVNGTIAPLYYASPAQINFQVPSNAPVGSAVEFQVVKASTGQILASTLFTIQPASPGLFTVDASGTGQLLAINAADGSINSATHPAKGGTFISLFGTGAGLVSGAPPDGTPSPNQPVPTDSLPEVYINGVHLDPADVTYSGLAPGFIGLWQINAKVPTIVPTPAFPVSVVVVYKGFISRLDEFGTPGRSTTIRTTP